MTEPRWPDDLLARSFAPRRNPLPAPTTEIFDEPRACAKLNFKWFSHVLGALETLTQPDAWAGDDTDVFTAQQQIEQLIEQLSFPCDESLIDVFGPTMPTFAEWEAQFLADYGVLPVIDPWVLLGQTLSYGSADDPTYTATVAGVDMTSVLSPGMRIRVSQATGGIKYFIITKVVFSTNTTITLYGGTDYDLTNQTISNPCYSTAKAPPGFPLDPAKWTVTYTDSTLRTQATPVNGTWYNIGSPTISIPIGCWQTSYQVCVRTTDVSAASWNASTTLSTANNSETDSDFTAFGASGNLIDLAFTLFREKFLNLTSKTSYFLNTRQQTSGGLDNLYNANSSSKLVIRAVCALL